MTVTRVTTGLSGMHTTLVNASAATGAYSVVTYQGGFNGPANSVPSDKKVTGLSGELLTVAEAELNEPTFGKTGA